MKILGGLLIAGALAMTAWLGYEVVTGTMTRLQREYNPPIDWMSLFDYCWPTIMALAVGIKLFRHKQKPLNE